MIRYIGFDRWSRYFVLYRVIEGSIGFFLLVVGSVRVYLFGFFVNFERLLWVYF